MHIFIRISRNELRLGGPLLRSVNLISDAEAAEERNQALLRELAAAATKLDDTLRSLLVHTPFINATRTVNQLLEDSKEDTGGVNEVTKGMEDAMDGL
jgi:hypothetical protein